MKVGLSGPPTIIQVAVLARLPRSSAVFDYAATRDLALKIKIGSLLKVPFRRRVCLGIVVARQPSSSFSNLKQIQQVVSERLVTTRQLTLIKKVALHYGVSLGSAMSLVIPVRPSKKFIPQIAVLPSRRPSVKGNWLVTYYQQSAKLKLASGLADKVVARGQQLLILVPDIKQARVWQRQVTGGPTLWHSDLKTSEQQSAWQVVASGSAKIIIGTRSALFLPWVNLGGIIVDDCEDENYKQSDHNPRYDGIEVAGWLKSIHHCSLALFSASPRLEDWFRAKGHSWSQRVTGIPHRQERITVVDLKEERKRGNQGLLSEILIQGIARVTNKQGKVFLYYNRRGNHTAVICRDCGRLAKCSKCERTLVWHTNLKRLLCHNCGRASPLPIPCPDCGGANLYYLGTGTAELETKLRQLFPQLNLVRLDIDTAAKLTDADIIKADILLGTAQAWPYLRQIPYGLVAVVSLESELAMPEFRASEFSWSLLRKLLAYSTGQLYIQTYQPNLAWLPSLAGQAQSFYHQLLSERRVFNWPPFIELIRFTVRGGISLAALKAARQLQQTLAGQVKELPGLRLSGPYPDYHLLVRGQYLYHLLLKYPRGWDPSSWWSILPTEVIIDRHPRYILS